MGKIIHNFTIKENRWEKNTTFLFYAVNYLLTPQIYLVLLRGLGNTWKRPTSITELFQVHKKLPYFFLRLKTECSVSIYSDRKKLSYNVNAVL